MVTGGKGAVHGSGPILTATVSLSFAPICFVSFCFFACCLMNLELMDDSPMKGKSGTATVVVFLLFLLLGSKCGVDDM
jgi:hypothetical protein